MTLKAKALSRILPTTISLTLHLDTYSKLRFVEHDDGTLNKLFSSLHPLGNSQAYWYWPEPPVHGTSTVQKSLALWNFVAARLKDSCDTWETCETCDACVVVRVWVWAWDMAIITIAMRTMIFWFIKSSFFDIIIKDGTFSDLYYKTALKMFRLSFVVHKKMFHVSVCRVKLKLRKTSFVTSLAASAWKML